jgi:hypothetical protein
MNATTAVATDNQSSVCYLKQSSVCYLVNANNSQARPTVALKLENLLKLSGVA